MSRLVFVLIAVASLSATTSGAAQGPLAQSVEDAKVLIARLETRNEYWDRHAEWGDWLVATLQRNTGINLDPEMHTASARNVDDLRKYPFILAHGIDDLRPAETLNLAEYLRRGGFLFIDACRDPNVNSDLDDFFRQQIARLRTEFPHLRSEVLPFDHPLFSCFYHVERFPTYPSARRHAAPLHALYDGDRMIAVVNLLGLQCPWTVFRGSGALYRHFSATMQLMINIYVYAMNR